MNKLTQWSWVVNKENRQRSFSSDITWKCWGRQVSAYVKMAAPLRVVLNEKSEEHRILYESLSGDNERKKV